MAKAERPIFTVTVVSSRLVARADGRVAIELTLKERDPIALEVNLQTIHDLRMELARAEQLLRQEPGKA